jgi:regulatory protein
LELERRLHREFPTQEFHPAISSALDKLEREGLLSELRMAQSFVRVRGGRLGRARIAAELDRRGVAEETIASALQSAPDETVVAADLWQRRFGAPAPDARGKARQARFLASRGFSGDIIRRLVFGG